MYANNQNRPRRYYFEVFDAEMAWSNLAGDPRKNKFHNNIRECNIYIPANAMTRYGERVVDAMVAAGADVEVIQPTEPGDQPKYRVYAKAFYGEYSPDIAIMNPDLTERPLDGDTVAEVDNMYRPKVCCVLYTRTKQNGKVDLQIQRMRVEGSVRRNEWNEYWNRRRAELAAQQASEQI